ncbi:MAG: DUF2288 domain-containing protein [Porticoccaceae bacterium]|nr:DUF2288 domain-containing protein [Porticoccaceae bacterium]
MQSSESTAELKKRLNGETAKIGWQQLQKHYACGNVLAAALGSDLIEVAIAMHRDDTAQIKNWLADGSVFEVSDDQAKSWYNKDSTVWALVIPPFVLVQEAKAN